jgi:cytochrome c oxidase subunit 2
VATVASVAYSDRMILLQDAASEHGQQIDTMMINTTLISILVVLITGTLLFYFAWRYQYREGEKALFYPHNNRLELIWTLVPAVVMTILVIHGFFVWKNTMIDGAPEDAIKLEMTGEQFRWTARYPGNDSIFGDAHVSFIEGINTLGLNLSDDKGHDDLVIDPTGGDIYLPKGRPVNVKIRSKDVLHSMTLVHFRVKMDAVPGMTTEFTFTPLYTTDEWRARTGNDEFDYEMSCQQICGSSHYNMRRVVKIVEPDEYEDWLATQKPFYATWKEFQPQNTAADESAEDGTISMN